MLLAKVPSMVGLESGGKGALMFISQFFLSAHIQQKN